MNVHTYIHDPAELLKEGTKIINTSSDAKYIIRVAFVNFILAKTATPQELSDLSGLPKRTINSWVKKVDEEGFESLKAVKQPGRTPRLSEEQMAEIKDALEKEPEESGYRVWDGATLSDYIHEQYGIELGVRQCQRLFRILGFSQIRPQKYPSLGERNEKEREDFKKN